MKKDIKGDVEMEEISQGANNRNLITVLITLIVLVVVAVMYWDRQNERNFQQAQTEIQTGLLEEWGPQSQQQVNSALGVKPVAFSKQVSYKNIVARVAPSVVSVNVGSSFINQGDPAIQPQPVAWGRGNVSAGVTAGYLRCPNCYNSVPCPRAGGAGNMVNCPNCGMCMTHGGMPWRYPFPAQSQPQAMQNQPADQLDGLSGFGQYVWGGRMGGSAMGPGGFLACPNCGIQVHHQRGVPASIINCPSCGTQMMRQGTSGVCPLPAGGQQLAAGPKDNQFKALGRGGSGVIVNSRGYVLTNHHVIHGARNITVTLSSGQITKKYPAKLIDEAPEADFAILKIVSNGEVFTPAPIGNSSAMSVGDEVLAIGSPFGLQQTVTFGIVSNTRRTLTVGNKTFTNFIQTDAPINPGSSGGPLINVNGEVIGITTAIYSPTQAFSGIGFASPIDPAKAAFPEFIDVTTNAAGAIRKNIPNWARGPALQPAAQIQRGQGLYPGRPPGRTVGRMRQVESSSNRPWLGIRVCAVDKQTRAFLGLPMGYGVLVMKVYDNSPCMAAGLQRGDIIYRADRRSVKDWSMLEALLARKRVGDKMKLTIYRDGKKISLNVKLFAASWARPTETILQAQAVALPVQPPGLTGVLLGAEVEAGAIEVLGMELGELTPGLALAS
ncbi:MAG: S1C family serine protease, partial [Planctomycetota bacterium]